MANISAHLSESIPSSPSPVLDVDDHSITHFKFSLLARENADRIVFSEKRGVSESIAPFTHISDNPGQMGTASTQDFSHPTFRSLFRDDGVNLNLYNITVNGSLCSMPGDKNILRKVFFVIRDQKSESASMDADSANGDLLCFGRFLMHKFADCSTKIKHCLFFCLTPPLLPMEKPTKR